MKVLAYGEVMLRLMCDDHKLLSQTDLFHGLYTGTGVNICAGLSQMGETVYLATTLPDSHVGTAAAAHLRKLGIHDTFVQYHGAHIGVYFLEQGIGNRASYVTYLNRRDSSFALADPDAYAFDEMIKGMDAVHICGIALAISDQTRACALALAQVAKKSGVPIFFDCNYRPSLWKDQDLDPKLYYQRMASLCDVMFASVRDGELLGLSEEGSEKDRLQRMLQSYDLRVVFGTRRYSTEHYQGYMVLQDQIVESDSYELTVFDRIGGGDAFAAGAIYGYLHGYQPKELIAYATASGVLGHTTYGDSPVLGKREIEQFLEAGKQDIVR